MAEIRNNIFSVCSLVVLLFCSIVFTQSTVAGSTRNVKRELADYSVSQNGATFDESVLIRNRNELSGKPKSNDLMANNRNFRSIYGLGPKMLQVSRSKVPIAYDLLVKNENDERSKRFDDYGHMRFGKRGGEEQFDDYGHMRFGRSG